MTPAETRDAAVRDAKRYIREIVRNDWIFEPATSTATTEADQQAQRQQKPLFQTAWPISEEGVSEWRVRDYDDSCSEYELQSPEPGDEDDGDEELAVELENKRRKRRGLMEEEMAWNEGLRVWMARRDAWAGARTRREIRKREEEIKRGDGGAVVPGSTPADENRDGPLVTGAGAGADNVDSSDLAEKTQSLNMDKNKDGKVDGKGEEDPGEQQDLEDPGEPAGTNITEPEAFPRGHPHHHHHRSDHHHDTITTTDADHNNLNQKGERESDVSDEPYIPVVPSILSNTNPIRAAINSSMYPSIYSKVIVQSLTPTVPINLADITKAMVQGWKADGTWPAKPPTSNIVLQDDATVPHQPSGNNNKKEKRGSSSPENHKKRGGVASAVRKVLHFSGFHPHHHPFHRRGGSSQHGSGNHGNANGNGHAEPRPSNADHK